MIGNKQTELPDFLAFEHSFLQAPKFSKKRTNSKKGKNPKRHFFFVKFHNQTTIFATSKPIPAISARLVSRIQTFAESRGMPGAGDKLRNKALNFIMRSLIL